mmetsp:Transcript_20826/g.46186  ORF Transcript_20826/g.46186 Transcript_20826/m.46186 type:complete len:293 (-) Transcript_20826:102-980(-)
MGCVQQRGGLAQPWAARGGQGFQPGPRLQPFAGARGRRAHRDVAEHGELHQGLGRRHQGRLLLGEQLGGEGRPRRGLLPGATPPSPGPVHAHRQEAAQPRQLLRELQPAVRPRGRHDLREGLRVAGDLLARGHRSVRVRRRARVQADAVAGLGRGLLHAEVHGADGRHAPPGLRDGGRQALPLRPVHRPDQGRLPRLEDRPGVLRLLGPVPGSGRRGRVRRPQEAAPAEVRPASASACRSEYPRRPVRRPEGQRIAASQAKRPGAPRKFTLEGACSRLAPLPSATVTPFVNR